MHSTQYRQTRHISSPANHIANPRLETTFNICRPTIVKGLVGGLDLGIKCGAYSVGFASAYTQVLTYHSDSVSTGVDWLGILVLRINPHVATQRTVKLYVQLATPTIVDSVHLHASNSMLGTLCTAVYEVIINSFTFECTDRQDMPTQSKRDTWTLNGRRSSDHGPSSMRCDRFSSSDLTYGVI